MSEDARLLIYNEIENVLIDFEDGDNSLEEAADIATDSIMELLENQKMIEECYAK